MLVGVWDGVSDGVLIAGVVLVGAAVVVVVGVAVAAGEVGCGDETFISLTAELPALS